MSWQVRLETVTDIDNFPDDLLNKRLKCDHTAGRTKFIDHDGHLILTLLQDIQQFIDRLHRTDEKGRTD